MLTGKTSKMIVATMSVGLLAGMPAVAGYGDDRDSDRATQDDSWEAENSDRGTATYITHDSQTRIVRRVHARVASPQVYYRANNPQPDVYYSATDRYPAQSTQFYSTHNPRYRQPYGWHRPHHQRGHHGHFRTGWGHHRPHRHHGVRRGHYNRYPSRCGPSSGVTIHIEF